jgi:hypothetical protein
VSDETFRCRHCGQTNTYPNHVANRYCATCQHYCDRPEGSAVMPENLGDPDWHAENTVEIGGEVMTPAQYDAARFPLTEERDRLRAAVDGWRGENDRHRALYVEAVKTRDRLRAAVAEWQAAHAALTGDGGEARCIAAARALAALDVRPTGEDA